MLEINHRWIPWTLSSFYQNFKEKTSIIGTTPIYIPSQEAEPSDPKVSRYEILHLGPDFDLLNAEEITAIVKFNVMVVTNKDPANPMYHYEMVGKGLSFFDRCVAIYKYGDVTDVQNDKSLLTTAELQDEVIVTDIGYISKTVKQQRTTMEAAYKVVF